MNDSGSMKVSVYIATSLDGFIARPDGSLDWLPGAGEENGVETAEARTAESEDYGWDTFWTSVDCLIQGRKTFEKVLSFGAWPYAGKRVLILSRDPDFSIPDTMAGWAESARGDLSKLLAELAAQDVRRVYVDGGQTIQAFLRQWLITDMTITRIPILIGKGIPLFGPLETDIPLAHVRTHTYANGFVQSVYELSRE
jgi:dihydrofolate reductase